MKSKCDIYETDEYKFINFSDILENIRDTFIDDISEFVLEYPLKLENRILKRYIASSTLEEVLKSWKYVDTRKNTVIVIPLDIDINSGGLFEDDTKFISHTNGIINKSKRKIPIMIKRVGCNFNELSTFLSSGEGKDFILQVESDKEKLRKQICSFEEFKIFIRKHKLKYISENLINKTEFKRLFIS